jgi:hypothetical protein
MSIACFEYAKTQDGLGSRRDGRSQGRYRKPHQVSFSSKRDDSFGLWVYSSVWYLLSTLAFHDPMFRIQCYEQNALFAKCTEVSLLAMLGAICCRWSRRRHRMYRALHILLQLDDLFVELQGELLSELVLIVSIDLRCCSFRDLLTFICNISRLSRPSNVPMKYINPFVGAPPLGVPNLISFLTGVFKTTR